MNAQIRTIGVALPRLAIGCYVEVMRDHCWVKSRIAARILLRAHGAPAGPAKAGIRILRVRDRRLARVLANDPGVTDRLIDQALACICAEKRIPVETYHAIVRATLASPD